MRIVTSEGKIKLQVLGLVLVSAVCFGLRLPISESSVNVRDFGVDQSTQLDLTSTDFVRLKGTQLVVGPGERVIYLRGVNFMLDRLDPGGGAEWIIGTCQELAANPSAIPVTNWYQEKHFQSLANVGFNVIRFDLHYRIFEDDKNPGSYKVSGWDFIDRNVRWAKNHNLYLILDIHVPQGGLQPTGGGGACLWDDNSNQTRLVNLWRAIAQGYANEPSIAAYDLLNEPNPTSSASQWQTLAQQVVDAIRQVDRNHLIVVERVNWIFASDGTSPLADWEPGLLSDLQISVNDSENKILYDFHFYEPTEYTLQNEGEVPDDGNYPDVTVIQTAKDGSTLPRSTNYLSHELILEIRNNESMFVGEWGPNLSTFNAQKGGYTYIRDVLDILRENNLHWTFYVMNNLYDIACCYEDNPTTPNPELINLFAEFFIPSNYIFLPIMYVSTE